MTKIKVKVKMETSLKSLNFNFLYFLIKSKKKITNGTSRVAGQVRQLNPKNNPASIK
jgi:hypothetical protein